MVLGTPIIFWFHVIIEVYWLLKFLLHSFDFDKIGLKSSGHTLSFILLRTVDYILLRVIGFKVIVAALCLRRGIWFLATVYLYSYGLVRFTNVVLDKPVTQFTPIHPKIYHH